MKQKRSLYYTHTSYDMIVFGYVILYNVVVIREKYQGCFYYVENGNLFLPTCTLYIMVLCGIYTVISRKYIPTVYKDSKATGSFLDILLSQKGFQYYVT